MYVMLTCILCLDRDLLVCSRRHPLWCSKARLMRLRQRQYRKANGWWVSPFYTAFLTVSPFYTACPTVSPPNSVSFLHCLSLLNEWQMAGKCLLCTLIVLGEQPANGWWVSFFYTDFVERLTNGWRVFFFDTDCRWCSIGKWLVSVSFLH